MKLTREQAIVEHRKMWNWIADQIEYYKTVLDIEKCKKLYLYINHFVFIYFDCFCCEYALNKYIEDNVIKLDDGMCTYCPIVWETKIGKTKCEVSEYGMCKEAKTWQEQAALARQIANLPERTDV